MGELITRKKDLLAETEGERQSAEANAQRLAAEAENLRDLLGRIEEQSRIRRTQEARARIAEHARAQAELMARRSNKGARLEGAASGAAPEREIEGTRSLADAADGAADADGGDAETAESEAPALAALSPNVLERPNNVRAFPPGDAIPLLIMPVRGRLVGAFGQRAADADSTSKGISIETRAQAQVVAPYDGQVVYAGEFRGYGQILITADDIIPCSPVSNGLTRWPGNGFSRGSPLESWAPRKSALQNFIWNSDRPGSQSIRCPGWQRRTTRCKVNAILATMGGIRHRTAAPRPPDRLDAGPKRRNL